MVKKTLKTLSQEDLELWKKITVQLKRNNPEVLIKNNISGFKIKKIAIIVSAINKIRKENLF